MTVSITDNRSRRHFNYDGDEQVKNSVKPSHPPDAEQQLPEHGIDHNLLVHSRARREACFISHHRRVWCDNCIDLNRVDCSDNDNDADRSPVNVVIKQYVRRTDGHRHLSLTPGVLRSTVQK